MEKRKNKPRVCVSVGRKTIEEVLAVVEQIEPVADVIEVRLDCLERIELSPLTERIGKPLLFTNRPTWEGGNYSGNEQTRVGSLLSAIRLNCGYVDLELRSPEESHKQLLTGRENSSTRIILSWHNFEMTPSRQDLLDTMRAMADRGGDIGKIVTMAHDYHDVLRVLQLQEEAAKIDFPLIAFCMGRAGVISRLATLELGGYMTYCAAHDGEATAPGQLSVDTLLHIYQRMVTNEH